MFLNLRHNSEHVDVMISGPGQRQQNRIFMFLKIHEKRIALWALKRFSRDILHLVKIVGIELKTSNWCQSTNKWTNIIEQKNKSFWNLYKVSFRRTLICQKFRPFKITWEGKIMVWWYQEENRTKMSWLLIFLNSFYAMKRWK